MNGSTGSGTRDRKSSWRMPWQASKSQFGRGVSADTLAISVQGLSVDYGEVSALSEVDLEVPQGCVTALVGMNGSGKSSLFGALMGLVAASAGRLHLYGCTSAEARRAGLVAYVPQAENIDHDFPVTVRDVVRMGRYGGLGPLRILRPVDHVAVTDAIERVGLVDFADRRIRALSGGQRKRAFVARALAQDARLLLLDEPFAGVDVTSERMLSTLLRELRDEGRSVLISTHDLQGVPALCDEVLLLHRRVIAHGSPAETLSAENLAKTFGGGQLR